MSEQDNESLGQRLRELDCQLGAYPIKLWQRWVSLSSRLGGEGLARLLPSTGQAVSSLTQVSTVLDPTFGPCNTPLLDPWFFSAPSQVEREGTEGEARLADNNRINFTVLSVERCPPGASAQEVTQHNLDSTYRLQKFLDLHKNIEEILVELQIAFLCFLVAQNYDSFEHWKQLVVLMCGAGKAMAKYPQLFLNFMSDLHFQMQEVPEDFFVDIISQNNFLVKCLTDLFANIREQDGVEEQLRARAISFENHLTKKFGWGFSDEYDEELAPVVVEL